jgi:putative intracellular protease/amidase
MRDRTLTNTVAAAACLTALGVVSAGALQQSSASRLSAPTVTGPVALTSPVRDAAHGYPFNASTIDLAKQGYVEEEFFIQGAARSYDVPRDQMSNATPASATHSYKTRIVVRRPAASGKFNGTAIVEWTNVSEGFDNEVDWFHTAEHLVAAGYAWVGVSAQNVGVSALKQWSGSRYGTLDVTDGGTVMGDALSYDIFTAAGQAVRGKASAGVTGQFKVERLIATGHSQSAGRLATYFNSVHPLAPVYDAVVLHGGGGKMRTDLNVKIWKLLSETDVLGQVATRQADSDKYRTWEVAGTSHLDIKHATELVKLGLRSKETMLPNPPPAPAGGGAGRRGGPGFGGTPGPFNGCNHPPLSRIPSEYVQSALYDHLARWLKDGIAPPAAPPIEIKTDGERPAIVRDSFGNALGGIRLSEHAVATATNSGENSGSGFCFLTGWHEGFDKSRLNTLYSTHAAYVSAVKAVTEQNVKAGYVLKADGQRTIAEAERAEVGKS